MLTENEARELMTAAAATIDVPPAAPIERRPTRRPWVAVTAAASAALAVVAVAALATRQDAPDVSTPGPQRETPTVTPLDPNRIPSVFAYDGVSAERLLEAMGLHVRVVPRYTCDTPGRAVETRPAGGTRFEPGDKVKLVVTEPPPNARCAAAPAPDAFAWELLDFANARGPAPAFAPQVTTYVNGRGRTLSATEAANLDSWDPGSALDVLAQETRRVALVNNQSYLGKALITARDPGSHLGCGDTDLPPDLAARPSIAGRITELGMGINLNCVSFNVFTTDGRIDALVVRFFPPEQVEPEPEPAPDVTPELQRIAQRFIAFARGNGSPPAFAESVQLHLGDAYQRILSAEEATRPESWDVCAVYADTPCPMSALRTVGAFQYRPAIHGKFAADCTERLGGAPLPSAEELVVLSVPEPATCRDDWVVEIGIDDAGQIVWVNLLLGSPEMR